MESHSSKQGTSNSDKTPHGKLLDTAQVLDSPDNWDGAIGTHEKLVGDSEASLQHSVQNPIMHQGVNDLNRVSNVIFILLNGHPNALCLSQPSDKIKHWIRQWEAEKGIPCDKLIVFLSNLINGALVDDGAVDTGGELESAAKVKIKDEPTASENNDAPPYVEIKASQPLSEVKQEQLPCESKLPTTPSTTSRQGQFVGMEDEAPPSETKKKRTRKRPCDIRNAILLAFKTVLILSPRKAADKWNKIPVEERKKLSPDFCEEILENAADKAIKDFRRYYPNAEEVIKNSLSSQQLPSAEDSLNQFLQRVVSLYMSTIRASHS